MILYRPTDVIKVKFDSVVFTISPLSTEQKMEIKRRAVKYLQGNETVDEFALVQSSLMHSLKSVKGIHYLDGTEFELEFDENGLAKEECVQELFNSENSAKVLNIATSLMNGELSKISEIDGVKVELPKKKKGKG